MDNFISLLAELFKCIHMCGLYENKGRLNQPFLVENFSTYAKEIRDDLCTSDFENKVLFMVMNFKMYSFYNSV